MVKEKKGEVNIKDNVDKPAASIAIATHIK